MVSSVLIREAPNKLRDVRGWETHEGNVTNGNLIFLVNIMAMKLNNDFLTPIKEQ